jgi:hypothetical protein
VQTSIGYAYDVSVVAKDITAVADLGRVDLLSDYFLKGVGEYSGTQFGGGQYTGGVAGSFARLVISGNNGQSVSENVNEQTAFDRSSYDVTKEGTSTFSFDARTGLELTVDIFSSFFASADSNQRFGFDGDDFFVNAENYGSASGFTLADPTFYFEDPDVADLFDIEVTSPDGFSLQAGVGQPTQPPSTVPSPASLFLISIGLAGLGWKRRNG